jgi:hypothetical protein
MIVFRLDFNFVGDIYQHPILAFFATGWNVKNIPFFSAAMLRRFGRPLRSAMAFISNVVSSYHLANGCLMCLRDVQVFRQQLLL